MERQHGEIKNYEHNGNDLNDLLTEKEVLLDSQKETCINQLEEVESLTEKLALTVIDRDLMEERVTESQDVITLQEEELKTLQDVLKNSR